MKHYTLIIEAVAIVTGSLAIAQFVRIHQLKNEVYRNDFAKKEWRRAYVRVSNELTPEQMLIEAATLRESARFIDLIKKV